MAREKTWIPSSYYIIPNFCGFPCAEYYAFNERSVGYFNKYRKIMQEYITIKKKFVIVSNSENENFRVAMMEQTMEEPEMLYLKSD